jgi:hypothetical protein
MSQKTVKTSLLKLSKTSCIMTAFRRRKMESQMVAVVTVTMQYLITWEYILIQMHGQIFLEALYSTKDYR